MSFRSIAALALAAIMVAPALADDAKKKKKGKERPARSASGALLKQLEVVGLTDEQKSKIAELGAAVTAARKEAGITPEIQKKLAEAQKSMKDSELKGKERMAAIQKAAGLTEAQAAALKKSNELRMKMHKEVFALLSDEQKAKLPEKLKKMAEASKRGGAKKAGAKKAGEKKGGAKKKKKDAA